MTVPVKCCNDPLLLGWGQLGEDVSLLGSNCKFFVLHDGDLTAQYDPSRLDLHFRTDLSGDDVVVAGQDLHGNTSRLKRRDSLTRRLFRWIEKGDVA